MKRITTFVAAFFLAGSGLAMAGPNCTCSYKGGDIAEGQTACINTANGPTLARCERVLNNTSWKMLDQPCPYSDMSIPDRAIMTAGIR